MTDTDESYPTYRKFIHHNLRSKNHGTCCEHATPSVEFYAVVSAVRVEYVHCSYWSDWPSMRVECVPGGGDWLSMRVECVPGGGDWLSMRVECVPDGGG